MKSLKATPTNCNFGNQKFRKTL